MNLSSFRQQGGSGLYMRERRFFFDCQENYSWTVPAGVTKVFAFVIGGGGGGGRREGSDSYDQSSAGGGAGGGYAHGYIATTPGNTITITVGKGGRGAGRSASSQAGTASSFGSYLTGNGGAAGPNSATNGGSNDGTTAWGTGGSASTSGVTEGYAAPGGGVGPGMNQSYTNYYGQGSATGGGSSGSPFGRGSNRPPIGYASANGGAGWSTGSYKNQGWEAYVAYQDSQMQGNAHGGDGSHHMNPWTGTKYSGKSANNAGVGGAGLQAMGGDSRIYRYQNGEPRDNINGQNGNPNWWFPWDIDGGGGGGSVWNGSSQTNDVDNTSRGGNGGPGAGGGGSHVDRETYNIGHLSIGGDGGFGGGGGAACAWGKYQSNQWACPTRGGNGGIGGGGGGCWTVDRMFNTNPHTTYGGNGGKGIVAVYW